MGGVLADLCKIFDAIGIVTHAEIVQVGNVHIIRAISANVTAANFMTAHVVHGFFGRAVFIDLPGEKLVESMAGVDAVVVAETGKNFDAVGGGVGTGGFIRIIKGAVFHVGGGVGDIGIRLLVALQVIPARKDDPAGAV